MENSPENDRSEGQKTLRTVLRFSGIGIQMMAIVLGGFLLGRYIDGKTEMDFPAWAFGLTILGMILAMYFLIKETGRKA